MLHVDETIRQDDGDVADEYDNEDSQEGKTDNGVDDDLPPIRGMGEALRMNVQL
jgi:hypothetical protein